MPEQVSLLAYRVGWGTPSVYSVTSGTPCESRSVRRRLAAAEIGDVAVRAGHVPGDVFDVEFSREGRKGRKSETYRGVLCADGAFELVDLSDEITTSADYMLDRLGGTLRRLGYDTEMVIDVDVEASPKTVRREESSSVMGRRPFHGILGFT